MDDAIGVITQELKNLGMMENTIIIFTSDVSKSREIILLHFFECKIAELMYCTGNTFSVYRMVAIHYKVAIIILCEETRILYGRVE